MSKMNKITIDKYLVHNQSPASNMDVTDPTQTSTPKRFHSSASDDSSILYEPKKQRNVSPKVTTVIEGIQLQMEKPIEVTTGASADVNAARPPSPIPVQTLTWVITAECSRPWRESYLINEVHSQNHMKAL